MSTTALCLYHANCVDGFAAAYIVYHALAGQVELRPVHYQEPPPPMADIARRDVIIVDFSYPPQIIREMAWHATSILILDHHASAKKAWDIATEKFKMPANVVARFDLKHCGAMLAWKHFSYPLQPPLWLQHVEDYDLWQFALPQTRVINAALSFYTRDIETWDKVLQSVKWPELIEIGDILLQSRTSTIQFFAKNSSLSTLGGHIVPTANVPPDFANDVGNILAQGWPFAVTYWNGAQYRYLSLRSAPDGMNVAEIAEGFGGGGHHHAAGFRLPLPTNVIV